MKTWKAAVRLRDGSYVDVQIQAKSSDDARKLLEAQYGAGCIIDGVWEV